MIPEGLLLVDKPAGLTSHDVVARVRRLAGTRRVGHAGTLDPMATGLLLLGLGRATRLLGHLALSDKAYAATIRLGQVTVTDDADGEVVTRVDASGLDESRIQAHVSALTGELLQVPSSVSAVKVAGQRAYARVRAGEEVELAPRRVVVHRFEVVSVRRAPGVVDVEVDVACSSGTYVRALARDLGTGLGVGGHLTALRRTRVGPYDVSGARTLDQLAEELATVPLPEAAARAFRRIDVDADTARRLVHGAPVPPLVHGAGPAAVFGPGGDFLALVEDRDRRARTLAVFSTRPRHDHPASQ